MKRLLLMTAVVLLSCSTAFAPPPKKGRWDDLPPPPEGQKRVWTDDGIPIDFIPAPELTPEQKAHLDYLALPRVEQQRIAREKFEKWNTQQKNN
jgi:hypothetical protein